VKGTTTVSPVRKALMLGEEGLVQCSPVRIELNFEGVWSTLSLFMCEEHQLCATFLRSRTWKKHYFSSKKIINVRSKRV
jgi:hypothetical protein